MLVSWKDDFLQHCCAPAGMTCQLLLSAMMWGLESRSECRMRRVFQNRGIVPFSFHDINVDAHGWPADSYSDLLLEQVPAGHLEENARG